MIQLVLFGAPELRTASGDKAHLVLAQAKHVTLLAMLATSRKALWRRDRLVGLLWPELDDDRARNALSKAIHNARRTLGDDAFVGRFAEEIGLEISRWSCDLWDFEDAIERGAYADAVALYRRGEWMEGLHIADASTLEHWIDGERVRLRRRAIEAASAVAGQAERAGDLSGAIEHLRLAGEWSPYDERIHRRYLTLLDRHADRAGAISAFSNFAARLQRDLAAVPSPETVALLETIRRRTAIAVDSSHESKENSTTGQEVTPTHPTEPPPAQGVEAKTPIGARARRKARRLWLVGGLSTFFTVGAMMRAASNRTEPSPSRAEGSTPDSIINAHRDFRTIIVLMGPGDERDSILRRDAYKMIQSTMATDTMFRILNAKYVSDQLRDARVPEAYIVDHDTIVANARFMGHAVSQVDVARFGVGFTVSMILNRTDRIKPIATFTGIAQDSSKLPTILRALVDSTTAVIRRASPELRITVNDRVLSPVAVQLFFKANEQNNRGNYLEAADLARASLRADSNYLGAWDAITMILGSTGLHRAERLHAASKAYALRTRGPLSGELWYTARWYAARRLYDSAYLAEKARPGGNYENFQGNARRAQGEFVMAEQEFRRMLARAPKSGLDQRNLALTLLDQGKIATADSLLAVMDTQPRLRRWVLEIRGVRAAALHNHEALIRNEESVAADSTNDSALRLRALGRLRIARAMTGNIRASDSLARLLQQRQDSLRDPGSALGSAAERAIVFALTGRDMAMAKRTLSEATVRYAPEKLAFMDRPYPALVTAHVLLGNLSEARRLKSEWERDVPPLFRLVDASAMADARGELALAEGRPADALLHFRADRTGNCAVCDNVNVARAFDALGRADSALYYFERYLDTPASNRSRHDMLWLAYATRRTGELFEKRGESQRAVSRYQSFIALRAKADTELAGEVVDVRVRIDRLRRP